MKTKETIAIIGATGNMGSSIARGLSKDNYRLLLMSTNARKLNELTSSLSTYESKASINANDCARDVSWEADIIIVATPYHVEQDLIQWWQVTSP